MEKQNCNTLQKKEENQSHTCLQQVHLRHHNYTSYILIVSDFKRVHDSLLFHTHTTLFTAGQHTKWNLQTVHVTLYRLKKQLKEAQSMY